MPDVLVLNADARPVSYLPLSVVEWKEAITYMCLDKCSNKTLISRSMSR